MEYSKDNTIIEWKDVRKKQARGIDGVDLGTVKEIGQTYVVTERRDVNNEKYYIPKYLAEGYDGSLLRFTITEEEARNTFMKDISSTSAENSLLKTGTMKEGKAKKGKSEIYAIIKKERELAKKNQRIQQFGFQQNNFLMSEKSSKRQNLRPMNSKK